MINKKNQHYQVKPSKRYNDEFSTGSELQTGAISLEDDLNALRTQIRRITGRDNWYDNSNFPSRTDLAFLFESSQKTWAEIFADSGSASPDRRQDTFRFEGGYGIDTQVIGKEVFIKRDQTEANYYGSYTDGVNSAVPDSSTDTLQIVGLGPNVTTTGEIVDGDKRVVVDYTGPGRQDIWYRIFDDDGSSIAPTSNPDVLEIWGDAGTISTTLSGKTVTISYVQDLSDGATPTFANVKIESLDDNGIVFVDADNFLVNDPDNFYFDPLNNRVGIGTSSPEENLHIQDGNILHTRENAVTLIGSIVDAAYENVRSLKYHKGFVYFVTRGTGNNNFIAVNVTDESNPTFASQEGLADDAGDSSIGGFEIAGRYAYVCIHNQFYVIDIQDPYNVVAIATLTVGSSDLQFPLVFGSIVLCFESDVNSSFGTNIHVIDISNPLSPISLYTDVTLSEFHGITSGMIRGNRLFLSGLSSGTGKTAIFDLSNIDSDIDFLSTRTINERTIGYGSNEFRSMFSTGNQIFLSDFSGDLILEEIVGNLEYINQENYASVHHGLIFGGGNSFYLLRDDQIVTVEFTSSNFSIKGIYTQPSGYEPKCGDSHGNRLYVYHQDGSGGQISIYENAFDATIFLESQRVTTDRLSAGTMTIEGDLSVRDSLNVGPEGVFVDQGHGVSVDGKVVSHGNVGLGFGNPLGRLHVGGGKFYHRSQIAVAESLNAIPYTPSSIVSDGNRLYVSSSEDDNLSVWDISEPNVLREIHTVPLSGATFPANIVVRGQTAYYAKTSNTFGITRFTKDSFSSSSLQLDFSAIIHQIIVFGKYAYIASNGTGGQSLYVIDVSDPSSPVQVGQWRVSSNPSNSIEIGFMHKVGNTIRLFGRSASFSYVEYRINVSNPQSPSLIASTISGSSPTVTTGYSVNENNIILVQNSVLTKQEVNESTNGFTENFTNTLGTVFGVLVLGNTIYVAGENGISLWDTENLSAPISTSDEANPNSFYCLAVTNRNLFLVTGEEDLAYFDLGNYEATSSKVGSAETDFMSTDFTSIVRNFDSEGMIISEILNKSELGVLSCSDISVLGKLSINTESIDTDYDINIDREDIRHESGSLYDEVETEIPDFSDSTKSIKFHNGFLYSLLVDTTENILKVVSVSSKESPETINSIYLGTSASYEATTFCLDGIYCYILFSDGRITIIDISYPAGENIVASRAYLGISTNFIDCYVKGKNLYAIDSSDFLRHINIADPSNPFLETSVDTTGSCFSIGPSNNEIYVVFTNGSGRIYDVSEGTPVYLSGESLDFLETPIKTDSYGHNIFCLYNDGSNAKIKIWERNFNTYITASPAGNLAEGRDFSVFENGYVVLTEEEISVIISETKGFTDPSPKVLDQVSLSSGSENSGLFLSLSKNRLYVVTAINSKLFSYDIGQLRVSAAQVEALSAFNAEIKELHSPGTLNAHSMLVGPGGLNVASSNGIRADGDLLVAGSSSFGSGSSNDNALTITNGNLSLVKKLSFSSKTISTGSPVGMACKGQYIFVFTSDDSIVCYRSEGYDEQIPICTLNTNTNAFKDAQIVGDYLYYINGDTFESTVFIIDISVPEDMSIVSFRSWFFPAEEDLQFYDMSKLLVVGNLMFVVTQTLKNRIIVLDISDKTNIRYIKYIDQFIFDIVDLCTNGKNIFAISQNNRIINWISLDTVLNDDHFVSVRPSETDVLINPTACKVYDNLLFVLNKDASESIIDIFETIGEVKSETDGLGVFEGGDLIGQIVLTSNVNDFIVGSEELITVSSSAINIYQLLRDYVIHLVDTDSVINGSELNEYKDQFRILELSSNRIKIYRQDSFKNLSVTSDSASTGNTLVRESGNIDKHLTSHSSINIGGFGFYSEGDLVIGRDFFSQGLGVGALSKSVDIYLKDRSLIIEKNKDPQPNSATSIGFVNQVVSSSDLYVPPVVDDNQTGSQGSGPTTPNDIMNGPKACTKRIGNYLYVVANDGGVENDGSLSVIDISNPKSPFFSGAVQDNAIDGCFKVDAQGSFVYIATPTTISIWDVQRKEDMTLLSSFDTSDFNDDDFPLDTTAKDVLSDIKDIAVSGKYLFVCGNDENFLTVFDIEVPSNPKIVAVANSEELGINSGGPVDADNMIIEGNKIYLAINGIQLTCLFFDATQIDRSPSMALLDRVRSQEEPQVNNSLAVAYPFFYSSAQDTERIYVCEFRNGTPIEISTYDDSDLNSSFVKMEAKEDYLYVMTESSFKILKRVDGILVLWAEYDSTQNPDGPGTWTDFELVGRYAYISDEEFNRILVIDLNGLVVDYFKTGYYESSETTVQQGLRGQGSLFMDGNVYIGNSLMSHGVLSTSIVQTGVIGQRSQDISSAKLALKGNIDVGESKARIPAERIFEQTSLSDTIGQIQKCVVNGNIAYILKSNKLYAIDLSSEIPEFLGEIRKNGISFFVKDFEIKNNELFIVEFSATWLIAHYKMPNKYSDIQSSNLISQIEIATQTQGQAFESQINSWGQYLTILCSFENNDLVLYVYDSFEKEIVVNKNLGTFSSGGLLFTQIESGVLYYCVQITSQIGYVDINSLPDSDSVSNGILNTLSEDFVAGMVIKDDWMYVATASEDNSDGIVRSYKIQRTDSPVITLKKTKLFNGSSSLDSLIACPDPRSMAIVGDTLFITTGSNEVDATDEGDFSPGLCAYRVDSEGDFDFLYKIKDFDTTGSPFIIKPCQHFLAMTYLDGSDYRAFLLKPTTAKFFGARFQTLNAESVVSEGGLQVTKNSSVGALISKGDIFTRGQATSYLGFSGQTYGHRSLNSSVEINADQVFNFEDIISISYTQDSVDIERGIEWNTNLWTVTRSGKYELVFSGAIRHDTSDSTAILDFNGVDSLEALIEANQYTPITASYIFEVELDESTTSENIQFGLSISGGSGAENFTVAKGSTLLLKKIG